VCALSGAVRNRAAVHGLIRANPGTGDVHVICGTTLVTWAVVAGDNTDVPGLWRIPHPRALTSPGYPDRVPVWIPYVRGERTPFHDSSLRARRFG
jgi:xylulokinase